MKNLVSAVQRLLAFCDAARAETGEGFKPSYTPEGFHSNWQNIERDLREALMAEISANDEQRVTLLEEHIAYLQYERDQLTTSFKSTIESLEVRIQHLRDKNAAAGRMIAKLRLQCEPGTREHAKQLAAIFRDLPLTDL